MGPTRHRASLALCKLSDPVALGAIQAFAFPLFAITMRANNSISLERGYNAFDSIF
jgi:hypothetical protein